MPTALKWVLGILVIAVVVVCYAAWYGYRRLQTFASAGPASTVTIGAPATRVFASIADADSMTEWRIEGLGIRSSRHGQLAVGDTVLAQSQAPGRMSNGRSRSSWIVTAIIPDVLLALEVRNDTTGVTMFTRRDSLISLGDSTRVVSTFTAPMFDTLQSRRVTSKKGASTLLNFASNVMIAGLRVMSDQELKRLKGHIEGRVLP